MKCPKCNAENINEAVKCGICGARLKHIKQNNIFTGSSNVESSVRRENKKAPTPPKQGTPPESKSLTESLMDKNVSIEDKARIFLDSWQDKAKDTWGDTQNPKKKKNLKIVWILLAVFMFGPAVLGIVASVVIPAVMSVIGITNAFNMIDGINGLCSSLAMSCFGCLLFISSPLPIGYILMIIISAIIGFLMYNLGILGNQRTVFLGDNGSNALGFMCAWILVYFSSVENSNFAPVTALWFVAIPFFDAVGVMASRAIKGIMPLRPGRDHLHHKLLDMGLSSNAIYMVLIFISALSAGIGYIFNHSFPESHYISFYAFMILWLCYYFLTRYISKNV